MITIYDVAATFSYLPAEIFPIPGWFIAGGAATCSNPSDIDIYFTSSTAFERVNSIFAAQYDTPYTSENAITYTTKRNTASSRKLTTHGYKPIQLVIRQFAPIPTIIADFDLNICRRAILPNGTLFTLPEANYPLYLDIPNLRSNSAGRYIKYLNRGFLTHTLRFEQLIHHLIANLDVELPIYYEGNAANTCFNLLNRLYSQPPLASVITCVIDSYSADVRTSLYSRLIHPTGEYVPDPSFSEEHQLATSTARPDHATATIRANYPELFI